MEGGFLRFGSGRFRGVQAAALYRLRISIRTAQIIELNLAVAAARVLVPAHPQRERYRVRFLKIKCIIRIYILFFITTWYIVKNFELEIKISF